MSDELTRIENDSIRAFVQHAADEGYLSGRVLDYGCGRQPYRDIVEAAGGEYHGFDRAAFPANASGDVGVAPFEGIMGAHGIIPDATWNAILCTQVVQYAPMPLLELLLGDFRACLVANGHLVLTGPTNWPEVEPEDLHRFTKAGMERLLTEAGFEVVLHVRRADFTQYGYEWAFGYGVVARA